MGDGVGELRVDRSARIMRRGRCGETLRGAAERGGPQHPRHRRPQPVRARRSRAQVHARARPCDAGGDLGLVFGVAGDDDGHSGGQSVLDAAVPPPFVTNTDVSGRSRS